MAALRLALLLSGRLALAALPAHAASAGEPLATAAPARSEEPRAAEPSATSASAGPQEPLPGDRPATRAPAAPTGSHDGEGGGVVPGELPPPRAIAVLPAPPPPKPLLRRTTLTGNLAGLARAPAGDHAGTWRAELALERAIKPNVSATGILSAGELRTDGRDDAWVAEITGQYRWYFLGRFDRGLYVAGTLGFWAIDPYLAWALGGGVGLKHTGPWGLTVDLQAGLQLPVEWFRHDRRGDPPRFREAWRTLLPGVLVNAGWSFEEGTVGRRSPRR